MGWFAFAFAVVVLLTVWWQLWRRWIQPTRDLKTLIEDVTAEKMPRTFLIGGSARLRAIALALEQLARREAQLRTRVQAGEFGVQAIVGTLADGLVVVDRERHIRLTNRAFREAFQLGQEITGLTLLESVRDAVIERLLGELLERGQPQRGAILLQRGST